MQLHNLKRKYPNKEMAEVGRGGKRGKTSGRGGKGQTARAGNKTRPEIRDFIKRVPKLRGYAFNTIERKPVPINLDVIEMEFANGDKVNPGTIVAKGILGTFKGGNPRIKILATGEITKKVTITGCTFSVAAKAKIEKAGGTINS